MDSKKRPNDLNPEIHLTGSSPASEPLLIPKGPIISQKYIPSLNGFRAISIILVIISHFAYKSTNPLFEIFSGYFGVTIFFVISGFLITSLLLKEKFDKGRISLRKFYVRRALRIIPASYLFVFVLFLLDKILNLKTPQDSYWCALLYLKNTPLLYTEDTYSAHFWSLSVEEQFYILFPWLLVLNQKVFTYILLALIAILPLGLFSDYYHLGPFQWDWFHIAFAFINQTSPILIGSLTAILVFDNKIQIQKICNPSSLLNLFIFAFAALILSGTHKIIPSVIKPSLSSLFIVYVLLNYMTPSKTAVFRFLNTPWLNYIGLLSYSLYIWQQIFTFHLPWKSFLGLPNVWEVNLLLLFLVSYISYTFYEKFFLNLKKEFK
jgi:peptidoglycan/LPS O-acetylase OafA/YrhL